MTNSIQDLHPDGLMGAFWSYERALMDNNLDVLDELFAASSTTLRGDAAGLLVGHAQISAYRAGRGGALPRSIVDIHVRAIDEDNAVIVAVTEFQAGGRGQQTQQWQRIDGAWKVVVAHVHQPQPALDTRIWRVVGNPLVAPPANSASRGPLAGESVAVKDIFSVHQYPVGAGNPARLAEALPAEANAPAVQALLNAGASIKGIAQTDEFAYSLAGSNHHYGTPPNPRAPYRSPGGSTSGGASAVSLGHAAVCLGSDTAGSIRVPAAYQGLFGIRTSHGTISVAGMLPLAPSFDTVGWLTRDAALLAKVGAVLLPDGPINDEADYFVATSLLEEAEAAVAAAVLAALPGRAVIDDEWRPAVETWSAAFQTLQAFEAWQTHGAWIQGKEGSLGPDVRDRFCYARSVTAEAATRAAEIVSAAREEIRARIGHKILLLPTTPTVAPPLHANTKAARQATLRLTCLAGIAGSPALSVPLITSDGLPCGLSLLASPGRDHDLLRLAQSEELASSFSVTSNRRQGACQ